MPSRCYIQWREDWDSAGKEAVARAKLQPVMVGSGGSSVDLSKLIQQMLAVHNSRVPTGATPHHYITFVSLCGSLCARKRTQLTEQQEFLKVRIQGELHAVLTSLLVYHVGKSALNACFKHWH